MATLGNNIKFQCNSGGVLTIVGGRDDMRQVGIENGWVVFDNVRIDTSADLTLNLSKSEYNLKGTVRHVTGRKILSFDVSSQVPNGTGTFRFDSLKPGAWYRMEFGGTVAQTASGSAHGQTTPSGLLQFDDVYIPNG